MICLYLVFVELFMVLFNFNNDFIIVVDVVWFVLFLWLIVLFFDKFIILFL